MAGDFGLVQFGEQEAEEALLRRSGKGGAELSSLGSRDRINGNGSRHMGRFRLDTRNFFTKRSVSPELVRELDWVLPLSSPDPEEEAHQEASGVKKDDEMFVHGLSTPCSSRSGDLGPIQQPEYHGCRRIGMKRPGKFVTSLTPDGSWIMVFALMVSSSHSSISLP